MSGKVETRASIMNGNETPLIKLIKAEKYGTALKLIQSGNSNPESVDGLNG
jgi:hypothetical protein